MPSRVYDEKKDLPKFAIVGGPNVGKSSFVNKILGEDRYIVTKQAGTTRDSLNTHYNSFGFDFILVDTAGIRKKSKVKENVEFLVEIINLILFFLVFQCLSEISLPRNPTQSYISSVVYQNPVLFVPSLGNVRARAQCLSTISSPVTKVWQRIVEQVGLGPK